MYIYILWFFPYKPTPIDGTPYIYISNILKVLIYGASSWIRQMPRDATPSPTHVRFSRFSNSTIANNGTPQIRSYIYIYYDYYYCCYYYYIYIIYNIIIYIYICIILYYIFWILYIYCIILILYYMPYILLYIYIYYITITSRTWEDIVAQLTKDDDT